MGTIETKGIWIQELGARKEEQSTQKINSIRVVSPGIYGTNNPLLSQKTKSIHVYTKHVIETLLILFS